MGVILVYDIMDEKSFENIQNWMKSIKENGSAGVEHLLLDKCTWRPRGRCRRSRPISWLQSKESDFSKLVLNPV